MKPTGPASSVMCWGGPYDGLRVEDVGPTRFVPLPRRYVAHLLAKDELVSTSEPFRRGIYEKRRQRGVLIYAWVPTPSTRSFYPNGGG